MEYDAPWHIHKTNSPAIRFPSLVGNDRDDNSVAFDGGCKCVLPLLRLSRE